MTSTPTSTASLPYKGQLRRYNRYQDIEIDAALLPHDELGRFLRALSDEEGKWLRRLGHRGTSRGVRSNALFWLKVPVTLSHLIPSLLGTGVFTVHHATSEYIMFVKGPGEQPPTSPPSYGTHYARVECVVVDPGSGDILVVHERIGTMDVCRKLVTGSVEPGEYIENAAEREVMEETGVRTRFSGILGIINRIGTRFGRDEILVGCLLEADPPGQAPAARSDEIRGVEWVQPRDMLSMGGCMGRRWVVAAANLAIMSKHPQGLRSSTMPDFRGHGHQMIMYAAL
jgi:8-oxo-dGTP pyrophosphatase MutT (NUDIX family)